MARLNWGMIGGGEGSQIGPAHRISAAIDSHYDMVAGALDADPVRGRDFAQRLGIAKDRAYGDWREMLAGEKDRPDRIDLVTRGLMGLTVACARCHDHKYEPVTTADYYALHGIFASCQIPEELPEIGPPPAKASTSPLTRGVRSVAPRYAGSAMGTRASMPSPSTHRSVRLPPRHT
jgi:hypothetical protein